MAAAVPRFGELEAPSSWRTAEFISDLHLQAAEPATFAAWRRYMEATQANAVFILGDLFEAWIGDDVALEPGFEADCAAVLRATAARLPVFFMHGNRDFLVGQALMRSTGATLLSDPTVLGFAGQRWLLSHGDALCLDDTAYQRFREEVRGQPWQANFLSQTLAQRKAIAAGLRKASGQRQQEVAGYADVDAGAAAAWLDAADAAVLVHGHTHRPAEHALAGARKRIVLSDWDAAATPPRLEVLRLDANGAERLALA